MEQQDKMDRSWEFEVNLSGLTVNPRGPQVDVPEGFYKVQLADLYINPDKPGRIVIRGEIVEGPFKGGTIFDGISKPDTVDAKVRYFWRVLAESVGYTAAAFDAGAIKMTRASFVDRTGYCYYKPGDREKSQYSVTQWHTAESFEKGKSLFDAANGTPGVSRNTPTDDKPLNGGGSVLKSDVMKELGIA